MAVLIVLGCSGPREWPHASQPPRDPATITREDVAPPSDVPGDVFDPR